MYKEKSNLNYLATIFNIRYICIINYICFIFHVN